MRPKIKIPGGAASRRDHSGTGCTYGRDLDRLSNGRVLLNLVTGGDEQELKGDGVYEDHTTRYKTATEYTTIWREILKRSHTGESFSFHGERLSVDEAKLLYPPIQQPHPPLWFGGSSDDAIELATDQVDTYLTWGATGSSQRKNCCGKSQGRS